MKNRATKQRARKSRESKLELELYGCRQASRSLRVIVKSQKARIDGLASELISIHALNNRNVAVLTQNPFSVEEIVRKIVSQIISPIARDIEHLRKALTKNRSRRS